MSNARFSRSSVLVLAPSNTAGYPRADAVCAFTFKVALAIAATTSEKTNRVEPILPWTWFIAVLMNLRHDNSIAGLEDDVLLGVLLFDDVLVVELVILLTSALGPNDDNVL